MNSLRRIWTQLYEYGGSPSGCIAFVSVGICFVAVRSGKVLQATPVTMMFVIALMGAIAAVGIHHRRRWAMLLGLGVYAIIAASQIVYLVVLEPTVKRITIRIAVLLWLAWAMREVWRIYQKKPAHDSSDGADSPMVSLVLLLKEPLHLDQTILSSVASKAWGTEVDPLDEADNESEHSFLGGESPHFMCWHKGSFFVIHNLDRPYFEDVNAVADSVLERRRQHAVRNHKAWVACDLIHWTGEGDDKGGAYRLIGRLLSELVDDNCLAVMDPETGELFPKDPETESKLRSDDPRSALKDVYHVPITSISSDDPRLQAAAAEARNRWTEFVTAFEQRSDSGDVFYVKSPFTENEITEFMWMKVEAIENDLIYGVLGNDPNEIKSLRDGSQVTAKVTELNDWMIQHSTGNLTGGFTLQVLAEHTAEQSRLRDEGQ